MRAITERKTHVPINCVFFFYTYQRDNQKASFEGHTIQWPKEKGQKDEQ